MDVNNYQHLLLFYRGMMDINSKYNNNNNQKNSNSILPVILLIILIVLILFLIFCKKSSSNNSIPQVPPSINYYLQIPPQCINQLQDRNYRQNYNNQLPNSYDSRPIFQEIQ